MGSGFLKIEFYIAPEYPCCSIPDGDTRHAHVYRRADAQEISISHPPVQGGEESRRYRILLAIKDGIPFVQVLHLHMDIAMTVGKLRRASKSV